MGICSKALSWHDKCPERTGILLLVPEDRQTVPEQRGPRAAGSPSLRSRRAAQCWDGSSCPGGEGEFRRELLSVRSGGAAAAWPGSELLLWLLLLGQELLLALNGICFPFFTVAAVVILTIFSSLVCKKNSQYKPLFWGPTTWLFAVGCSEQRYWAGCVTEGTEKGNLHRSIQRGVKQFCKTEDAVWLCASALLTRPPLLPVIIIFKVCVGS